MHPSRPSYGFTLAELLLALVILGIIATFTIPKVLTAQQDTKFRALAKETAGMLSGAFESYRLQNTVVTTTKFPNITPYMNYVAVDTSSTIDLTYGSGTRACGGGYGCLKLHNGAIVLYSTSETLCGTGNNALYMYFDPDGVADASSTGPGKSVLFFMYANGRLRTSDTVETGTQAGNGAGTCTQTYNPSSGSDPPWFGWN